MFEITATITGSTRREVREQMAENGVEYTENKGFFSSTFIFRTASKTRAMALVAYVEALTV